MHNRGANTQKATNPGKTLKELLKYFKDFKLSLIVVFTFSILSTVLIIAGPKIMSRATNTIVDGYVKQKTYDGIVSNLPEGTPLDKLDGSKLVEEMPNKDELSKEQKEIITNMDFSKRPKMDFDKILGIINICIIIYAISAIFNYIQAYIVAVVSQKVTYRLRDKIFKKIDRIPLNYYDKNNNGDILSRMTNDVDTLGHTITMNLSQAVSLVAGVLGILIMMLSIKFLMTLAALVTLAL